MIFKSQASGESMTEMGRQMSMTNGQLPQKSEVPEEVKLRGSKVQVGDTDHIGDTTDSTVNCARARVTVIAWTPSGRLRAMKKIGAPVLMLDMDCFGG